MFHFVIIRPTIYLFKNKLAIKINKIDRRLKAHYQNRKHSKKINLKTQINFQQFNKKTICN